MNWKVLKKFKGRGGGLLFNEIRISGKNGEYIHFSKEIGKELAPKVEILESKGSKGNVLIGFRKSDSVDAYKMTYQKPSKKYFYYDLHRKIGVKNGKYFVKKEGNIFYIEAEEINNKEVGVNGRNG